MARQRGRHTKQKRPSRAVTVVLIVMLVVGICLLLYPTVSNWWNTQRMSRVVESYDQTVSGLSEEEIEAAFSAAHDYNEELAALGSATTLVDPEAVPGYDDLLDVDGTSVMGYVTIEEIDQCLPIYHGTSDAVLASGAGHLQGSSLPVGGESTHAVIAAHRGLPSAMLFTDLDRLELGDIFTVTVLDEVFTYEVDQFTTVDSTDVAQLYIEDGRDYCTLMTCTPYGINTQRLLVRGHRVPNREDAGWVSSDARMIDPLLITAAVVVVLCIIGAVVLAIYYGRRRHRSTPQRPS